MKKLALIVALLLCLPFFACRVRASEINTTMPDEEKLVDNLLEALPDLAYEKIGDKLKDGDTSALVGVDYLATLVFDAVRNEGGSVARNACVLLSFVIFYALLSFFCDGVGQGFHKMSTDVLVIICAVCTCRMFSGCVEMAYAFISDAAQFTRSLIPITTSLYLMGGNSATALNASAGASASLLCIESLCDVALPFLIRTMLALTLVGCIGTSAPYNSLCKSVRNTYLGVLGFFTMVLFCALTFGNIVSSAQDSVAARAVKYAIGSSLPIVGSTVNSAYGTLSASVSLIKSTVGVSSLVAIGVISLPVIIRLMLLRLALNICADIAQMLDCSRIGKLYSELRAVYDLALSAVVFVALVFVIIISVFLKCASAIG